MFFHVELANAKRNLRRNLFEAWPRAKRFQPLCLSVVARVQTTRFKAVATSKRFGYAAASTNPRETVSAFVEPLLGIGQLISVGGLEGFSPLRATF